MEGGRGREHEVWKEAEGGNMRCGGRQREGGRGKGA